MKEYPDIRELVPHRPPMVLLDGVEDDAEGSITCRVELHPESPFVENGAVGAHVAVEYMAQCVATYAGLKAHRRGDPIRIGYIIGARSVDLLTETFAVGETLTVRADHVWGDDTLGKFDCTIDADGRRLATGVLTVFQGDPDTVELGRAAAP